MIEISKYYDFGSKRFVLEKRYNISKYFSGVTRGPGRSLNPQYFLVVMKTVKKKIVSKISLKRNDAMSNNWNQALMS